MTVVIRLILREPPCSYLAWNKARAKEALDFSCGILTGIIDFSMQEEQNGKQIIILNRELGLISDPSQAS